MPQFYRRSSMGEVKPATVSKGKLTMADLRQPQTVSPIILLSVILAFVAGVGLGYLIWSKDAPPAQQKTVVVDQNDNAEQKGKLPEVGPGDAPWQPKGGKGNNLQLQPDLDAELRRFLDIKFGESQDYGVEVNYDRPIKEAVGHFAKITDRVPIGDLREDAAKKGKKQLVFRIFDADREYRAGDALNHLRNKGFRPADLKEMAAFSHTMKQKWSYVTAFGSSIEECFPSMTNRENGWELYWHPGHIPFRFQDERFLGVKK